MQFFRDSNCSTTSGARAGIISEQQCGDEEEVEEQEEEHTDPVAGVDQVRAKRLFFTRTCGEFAKDPEKTILGTDWCHEFLNSHRNELPTPPLPPCVRGSGLDSWREERQDFLAKHPLYIQDKEWAHLLESEHRWVSLGISQTKSPAPSDLLPQEPVWDYKTLHLTPPTSSSSSSRMSFAFHLKFFDWAEQQHRLTLEEVDEAILQTHHLLENGVSLGISQTKCGAGGPTLGGSHDPGWLVDTGCAQHIIDHENQRDVRGSRPANETIDTVGGQVKVTRKADVDVPGLPQRKFDGKRWASVIKGSPHGVSPGELVEEEEYELHWTKPLGCHLTPPDAAKWFSQQT